MKRMLDQKTIDELQALIDNGATSGLAWVNGIKGLVYEDNAFLYLEDETHNSSIMIADDGFSFTIGDNDQFITFSENEILFNGKPLGTKLYKHAIVDGEDLDFIVINWSAEAITNTSDIVCGANALVILDNSNNQLCTALVLNETEFGYTQANGNSVPAVQMGTVVDTITPL